MLPWTRWLFTPAALVGGFGLVLAALGLLATHWTEARARLPGLREFFTFPTLLYLWLALRRVRGVDPAWVSGAALALAISAHLSAMYLVPSYVVLVALEKRPLPQKLLSLALPIAFLALLLFVLGYRPAQWQAPLHAATSGMREGFEGVTIHRPYGFFSYGHLSDVANVLFLAIPVPVLLLLGWAAGQPRSARPLPRALAVLAAAALPGLLLSIWLMTPVAPAQD